jgi:hypothetical protein
MSKPPGKIVEVIGRKGSTRYLEYEINSLERLVANLDENSKAFLEFVPVKLVTLIENTVRGQVEYLVESGEPYTSRAIEAITRLSSRNLAQSLKYFTTKQLTIAQLAAHGFSISSLSDVFSVLGNIYDIGNVGEILESQTTRWSEDVGLDAIPIIKDASKTIKCVQQIFEARHIAVHEVVHFSAPSRDVAMEYIEHAQQFIGAIEWMGIQAVQGVTPRTQSGMTRCAAENALKWSKELDVLRGGSAKDFIEPKTPVEQLEHHWDEFVRLTGDRCGGFLDEKHPGSIAPMLRASGMERLWRWRVENYAMQKRNGGAG